MPVDPSVILGVNPPPSPMDMYGKALNLKELQMNTQLQQQKIQENQQNIKNQQLMAKIMTVPGNFDPTKGGITDQGIAQIGAVNPQMAQELATKRMAIQEQQSLLDEHKAITADKIIDRSEKIGKLIDEIKVNALTAYHEKIDKGMAPEAAFKEGQNAVTEGVDALKTSGILHPEEASRINPVFNPEKMAANSPGWRAILEKKNADKNPPMVKDVEFISNMEEKASKLPKGSPERLKIEQEVKTLKAQLPSSLRAQTNVYVTNRQNAANAGTPSQAINAQGNIDEANILKGMAKIGYSKDGATLAAMNRAVYDKYPPGFGKGAIGRNALIDDYAALLAQNAGMSLETLATLPSEKKAIAASLIKQTAKTAALTGTLESFHNNINTWEEIASGIPPTLAGKATEEMKDAFHKIDLTKIKSLNDLENTIKKNFNDPATVSYLTGAWTVAMDYARINSSGGQSAAMVTDTAMKDATNLIASGYDKTERHALITTLKADAEGQIRGQQKAIDNLKNQLGVFGKQTGEDKPTGISDMPQGFYKTTKYSVNGKPLWYNKATGKYREGE